MHVSADIEVNPFENVNQYVLDIKNQTSSSAASVLIIQNGAIVNEWYSGRHDGSEHSRVVDANSRFNVASVRKTYLGFAISLALYERRIESLDDAAGKYLDDLDDELTGDVTIRHLLTHTHGLSSAGTNMFPAGSDWKYNNAGVNLLIRMVQNVFDQPLAKVIEERLLMPYGLSETGWRKDKSDHLVWLNEAYLGEQGDEANLFVSTRDLGFWGYIHLTKGFYRGRQILPRQVFEQAAKIITPPSLDQRLPRNGFFWQVQDSEARAASELGEQLPEGSYQSLGFYGNALLIIPAYNVAAVRMLNQTTSNPPGYDYLEDIRTFGDRVLACIKKV
ncbi:serine hydrolase [Paenibacillus sp. R14(2021)]|uniref:serine hydrolase domain-containing protein n=1 Tax=Paenibacillus sp. R14(2021) TaxID=2859228 RepID=UPI001C612FB0|nr:serine hydrolase domain-containing protein [Paenibacillus sp. R14(2021)]